MLLELDRDLRRVYHLEWCSFRGPPQGTSQEFPDEMRRSLSTSLPSPAHRRRQEGATGHVHSFGGKCSTNRFPPGAEGDRHRKQQLVRPHRLGRRSAPPESNSGSLESNGASVIGQFASSHFQDKLSVGVE